MIGIKVKVRNRNEDGLQEDIFECVSEPYVAQNHIRNVSQTFVMLCNLKTNEVVETMVSQLAERVNQIQN